LTPPSKQQAHEAPQAPPRPGARPALHAHAFNSIADAISVVDRAMRYVLVNDAWCQLTGIRREAALGLVAPQVLGPTDFLSDERHNALQTCLRERRLVRVTSTHVDSLGAEQHLETTHTPYRDPAGRVLGAVLSTRDVTAERRVLALLQASEAQQRALLEAFPGLIGALDEQMRYRYVNGRLAKLFGRPVADLIGRPVHEVLSAERAAQVEREVRLAFAGEITRFERHYPAVPPAPDGTPGRAALDLDVMHVATPPMPGQPRAVFAFGLDVTERTAAQRALLAARDEAEQANRAKSRFLAQMSHELRTPLHAISGFAQLLALDRALDAQQSDYVREIQHGAQHLLELISEVLDLGRIESGHMRLHLEAVPLLPLLQECRALVQPLADERSVRLREIRLAAGAAAGTPDGEGGESGETGEGGDVADVGEAAEVGEVSGRPVVRADRMRLKQVLLNLLANAVKYNHREGDVDVAVETRLQAAGRAAWRIVVRDSGPGLDAAARERLFMPFERLGAERSAVEGTGIGLALSRRLVLAMGGEIDVDSTPGEGSRFWVELAAADSDLVAEDVMVPGSGLDAPAETPPSVRSATVLHVDDNAVNLVLMEAMFARLAEQTPGLRLLSAATGADGLRLALQERPQLVLLDIQLPDMDGYEVARRLRKVDPALPVVAVSANAMPADVAAAADAGFVEYLTKPLEVERLHATVLRWLAGRWEA
jgi:PAS domain S-box-containing protein